MGWTKVDVDQEQLIRRLAIIEAEIRALLGDDNPKGEFFDGFQAYFSGGDGFAGINRPVMIDSDKGVWIFK